MDDGLVKTGIDIIGPVPWGTHFCQFYHTKEDLLDTLVPYFKAGLENNEFCMWVTAEPLTAQDADEAMRSAMPDFADRLAKGQIEVIPHTEWYLRGGSFNLGRVLNGWVEKLSSALAKGYEGLRVTGNTAWLERRDWDGFTEYEAAINGVIGRHRMMALCTYWLDRCNAADVMDVIRNHEFALVRKEGKWELIENAIYKQTKESMKRSEERFRSIFEESPVGIEIYDADGKLVTANNACLKIFGVPALNEVKGFELFEDLNVSDEVKEQLRRGETARYENLFDFEKVKEHQLYSTSRSGTARLDVMITPISTGGGEVAGGYLVQVQDITNRKEMEDELRRSRDLMEAVTDGTGVMIAAEDANYRYTYFNKAYKEEIRRLTGKELHNGDSMIELFADMPDQQKVAVEEWSQMLRGKTVTQRIEFGDPGRHRTVYRVFHAPIRDQKGEVVGAGEVSFDISQQVRMEKALRQSEAGLKRAQEIAHLGTWELDVLNNRLTWSDEVYRIFGLNPQEFGATYEAFLDAVHPDDRAAVDGAYSSSLRERRDTYEIEHRVVAKSTGDVRFVHERCEHIRDGSGRVVRSVGMVQDITERKLAEESLREMRDYLDNLLNYANAPIIVWDPDLNVTKFNRAFQKLTGYMESEVIGKRLDMLFPEQSREESLAHISRAAAGERWEVIEIPIQRKDGMVRTVLWNSANIRASDGETTLSTIAQGQDITERKQAEDALRETRDYLDNLLNYANAPIIVWDPELRITKFNRAFQRLTGYQEAEALGQNLAMLFPEETREESLSHIHRTAVGERWETVEIPILRVDGKVRTVLWNSANIYASDGQGPVATIAQGQDITERKRAEEQLGFQANVLSHLFDAVVAVDNDRKVTYWNAIAEDLYGVAKEEAIGQMVDSLYQIAWLNREDEPNFVESLATKGRWTGDQFHVKKTGDRMFVRASVSVIRDADGAPAGTVAVTRDRTKLWQAEQEVKLLNERLRQQAEDRLRATDASFRRAIASSADGIVVVRKDGVIRFANPAAEGLIGRGAGEMVGTLFKFPLVEGTEIEIPKGNGDKAIAEMRIVELEWEGAPAYLATFRDITRRKQGLLALQESETRLKLLLDQIPCVSWTLDTKLRFTSFTGSGMEAFKATPDQMLGMSLAEYFKIEDLDFTPYAAHRQALQGIPATYELTWAGRTFYGRVDSLTDSDDHIVGVVGVAFDITERKQAEEQLRSLSHRLVTAQENERRNIARELHDEVGQSLTALKLCLDKTSSARYTVHGSELGEAREALRDLMARVRSMSLELRPTMLDDLGLLPTLLWHFKRYTAQTNVRVHFKHRGLRKDLTQDIVTAAYRIVQEALTNVARYAQVNEVLVCVRAEHDALVVEVEDQGVGFDADKVASASMGLNGMHERALALNGKLLVQSKPGEGTCVIAELPLAKRTRKRRRSKKNDNRSSG